MKIRKRPLGLNAQQSARLLPEQWQVFRFGIEDPLANHMFITVQGFINVLEAQVGHANGVAVGKGKGKAKLPAPILPNGPPFFGQPLLLPLLQFPQHGSKLMSYVVMSDE